MKTFSFFTAKTIYFGLGVINQTGIVLKELSINNVLVVTDKFLVESGLVNQVTTILQAAGVEYHVFSDVEPSPTISNAENCYKLLKECGAKAVLGVGGGSPADVAKVAAVLGNNPLPVKQYIGVEKVPNPAIPIIIIPTTAGTGSEVSNAAILKDNETHIKGGVMSHHIAPIAAIVDPTLTLTLPPRLTTSTGMDALTHAIEGYVAVKASPMTEMYHKEAIRLIAENLRTAVALGKDIEARYNMSLGATLAGIGMATAGCGAVHAMAYPMEGKYKIYHGDANAALLPAFMRFSVLANMKKFSEIAVLMGENIKGLSLRDAALKSTEAVSALCADIGVPRLRDIGVIETDLDTFAEISIGISRLMDNSPRKVTLADAKKIYRESF
jgi:alcohol dehydrogenase class IV